MSHVCFLCRTLLQHISESIIRVLTEAEMLTFFQLFMENVILLLQYVILLENLWHRLKYRFCLQENIPGYTTCVIQTIIKSKPFLLMQFMQWDSLRKRFGFYFYFLELLSPQKSTNDPSTFFHLGDIFWLFSSSIVANALAFSSVVISR